MPETQTKSPPKSPDAAAAIQGERCECLRCERVIPTHLVLKNWINQNLATLTVQRVRFKCPHCDMIYVAERKLSNGFLVPAGEVRVMTEAREIEKFNRVIDQLTGGRQIDTTEAQTA
jgi:hypothetical protein